MQHMIKILFYRLIMQREVEDIHLERFDVLLLIWGNPRKAGKAGKTGNPRKPRKAENPRKPRKQEKPINE